MLPCIYVLLIFFEKRKWGIFPTFKDITDMYAYNDNPDSPELLSRFLTKFSKSIEEIKQYYTAARFFDGRRR